MTPPAAQAAWTTGTKIHGGKAQVCKVRVDDGVFKIRLRLDNRNARHTHTAGLSRTRGTSVDSIKVRAGAGNVSSTKVLGWRSGDQRVLSVGMGETDGRGLGGGISLSQIPGC